MIKLSQGLPLYHGSYTEVSVIDLKKCSGGLDFGKGFYVTSSQKQAISYVPSSVRKAKRRRMNNYVAGAYGVPGTEQADRIAIELLEPERLTDQFCFRTINAIRTLEFLRSDRYGDNN